MSLIVPESKSVPHLDNRSDDIIEVARLESGSEGGEDVVNRVA